MATYKCAKCKSDKCDRACKLCNKEHYCCAECQVKRWPYHHCNDECVHCAMLHDKLYATLAKRGLPGNWRSGEYERFLAFECVKWHEAGLEAGCDPLLLTEHGYPAGPVMCEHCFFAKADRSCQVCHKAHYCSAKCQEADKSLHQKYTCLMQPPQAYGVRPWSDCVKNETARSRVMPAYPGSDSLLGGPLEATTERHGVA